MQRILLLVALAIALVSCGSNDLPVSDEPSGTGQNPEPTAVTAEATTAPITTAPTTAVGTESDGDSDGQETDELFPDVVAVNAIQADDGTYRFDVTLSSPYDSPERYADGWRILGPDGTELGVRFLTHDHASEQPFTRSLADVEIPADVTTVTVEGRDQVSGWGGATVSVDL